MMTNQGLTRLAPEVRTLARPSSGSLLSVRSLVQRDADLQAVFLKGKAEGWSSEVMAEAMQPVLLDKLTGTAEELREAALYLADEYLQDGEGILLVSRETGKVLARITEEDVWQPPPVRREDGSMVRPLPRLRPDLEGFLVQWMVDRDREQQFVAGLTGPRAASSTARALTHEGRKGIVERIRANADLLLAGLKGNPQAFLEAFDVPEEDESEPDWLTPLPRAMAVARTRMALADFKATNLHFDVLTNQQAVIGTQWVTDMARTLALAHPDIQDVPEMTDDLLDEATFWAGQPGVIELCRDREWPYLALDGGVSVGLRGPVGVLQVHADSYRVASREIMDYWEVVATLEYTLWVDWRKVTGVRVKEQPKVTVL